MRTGQSAIGRGARAARAAARAAGEKPPGQCSNGSLQASYGFDRTGTGPLGDPPGGPLAAVGIITFDGAGNYTTVQNISRNAEFSLDEEFEGGYGVGPDCTGGIDGGLQIVVVDDGKSFYGLTLFEGFTAYYVATRIHNGRGGAR